MRAGIGFFILGLLGVVCFGGLLLVLILDRKTRQERERDLPQAA